MRIYARHFNLYFALMLAMTLLCGCQTEKSKKAKQVSAVRIHLEVAADDPQTTQSISVLRADPVTLTIDKEPLFTEANLIAAKIVNTPGGFAIQLNFDENSTFILEQNTAGNEGKRLAIYGQWGEKLAQGRWLAAPMITHRIYDGSLIFTPDMSQDEANRFIVGLTNVIAKIQKGQFK